MRSTAAARRYARALFSLARDENRVGEIQEEVDGLSAMFEQSPELREVLLTPLHPVKERKAVLNALTLQGHLSPTVRHFYAYLVEQRRLVEFEAVRTEYARLAQEASGRTTAEVVSASPIDDARRERLRQVLSTRTGLEVDLDVRVDPALIGGAIAKVGDLVFDGSLRTQLAQLRSNLTKGSAS
jgi:F-type H+-transporting ATPase subunit delta